MNNKEDLLHNNYNNQHQILIKIIIKVLNI